MRSFVEICLPNACNLSIHLKIQKITITICARDLDCKPNKYLR